MSIGFRCGCETPYHPPGMPCRHVGGCLVERRKQVIWFNGPIKYIGVRRPHIVIGDDDHEPVRPLP